MVKIISAKTADIPIIQKIANQTWPVTFKDILSPSQIEYMLDLMYSSKALKIQMEEKQHKFLLAKENQDFLGFLSYELNFDKSPKTKIHKIYILPDSQGKGVGKNLIQSAREAAIKNNNSIVSLNVNKYNKGAIDFYQKLGFYEARQEVIAIGNGYLMEDLVMEMKL